ncbi:unnamed protein product [Arctogadus glacialis]
MQPRVKRGRIALRSNTPPTTALLHRNTNLSRPNHLHPHHSLRPHPQHRSHLCPTLFPRPSPLDLRCTYRAHPQAPPLPDLNQKQSTPDTNLSPESPRLSHRLIRPAPSLTHNKHSPAPNFCPAPSYSPVPSLASGWEGRREGVGVEGRAEAPPTLDTRETSSPPPAGSSEPVDSRTAVSERVS